jgi:hypothetical protein
MSVSSQIYCILFKIAIAAGRCRHVEDEALEWNIEEMPTYLNRERSM